MIGFRLLAFLIDYFILGLISLPISIYSWSHILNNYPQDIRVISILFTFSILFFYFFLFELIWRKTLGKAILKLKVVTELNSNYWFGKIFIRTLSRFIPLEPLSFLLYKNEFFLHDKLSKTKVVKN